MTCYSRLSWHWCFSLCKTLLQDSFFHMSLLGPCMSGLYFAAYTCFQSGVVSLKNNSGNAKLERRRRESIEAPKAPRGVRCGEGASPSPPGEGSVDSPLPRKIFRYWILHKRILVQTESFLYSSPKAGFSYKRRSKCQTLAISMPMIVSFRPTGLRSCCYYLFIRRAGLVR